MIKSLKNINLKLYFALLVMGLCPTVYVTVRTFFLGQLPGEWAYSIAGQLSWVNLIYEIINEAIILPLFFFVGKIVNDKDEFTNRLKTGLLTSFCIYLLLGAVIFAAPSIYRSFIQDLISLNYSAYAGPNGTNPDEFLFPGTNVRVVRTPGLAGSLKLVGTFGDNLVYGCDMENDHEDIDLWWSQDDRVFKYQVKWNSGVAYQFPDQVVVGTFAAAPSALGICPCKSE